MEGEARGRFKGQPERGAPNGRRAHSILVSQRPGRPLPKPQTPSDAITLWTAPLLRYKDHREINNSVWYAAHRAEEAAMLVSDAEMTRLIGWILAHTALNQLAERRRSNWRLLRQVLGRWLLRDTYSDVTPFGFALTVAADRRDDILRALHRERIFATVHRPSLASPAEVFPIEHELCGRLITLPCDHRYDQDAMHHLAQRVLTLVS